MTMTHSDDAELQRALELSAKEHAAQVSRDVLRTEFRVRRTDLPPPCAHHWPRQRVPQEGLLLQVDTLNQFGPWAKPLIKEFETPSAICGYMAMANAVLLRRLLPRGGGWSLASLQSAWERLRDAEAVRPVVREAMEFVARSRRAWVQSHPRDFRTARARADYMTAWVANYEISDFFRARATAGAGDPGLYFARFNQWPEVSDATHEELQRLREEKRFGGVADPFGKITYGPDDAVYFVERFVPERRLEAPAEFGATPACSPQRCGHLVVANPQPLIPTGRLSGSNRFQPFFFAKQVHSMRAAPGQDPTPKGGGSPAPPLQIPKWLYGTMGFVAPEAPEILFLAYGRGKFLCLTLCVYTQNTQNFVDNSKMDEKHKKGF